MRECKNCGRKEVCQDIINLLFYHGITKFTFKGKKSKYKLVVGYND